MRILLIEGNSRDAERVMRSFASGELAHHTTMDVVQNGRQALEFLFGASGVAEKADRSPHVILLDLALPAADGAVDRTEVLRALKNDERTRRIPVVVLTGARDPQLMHTCYELGVNSYVLKPQQSEDFEAVVREVGKYWVRLNEPPIH